MGGGAGGAPPLGSATAILQISLITFQTERLTQPEYLCVRRTTVRKQYCQGFAITHNNGRNNPSLPESLQYQIMMVVGESGSHK